MKYETFIKTESGKFHFVGWNEMTREEFVIETKQRGKYLYKTYKWLNGDITIYRYTIN